MGAKEHALGGQIPGGASGDPWLDHLLKTGEQLQLTCAQKTAIASLASERTRLGAEQAQTIAKISEQAGQLDDATAELGKLASPTETGPLDVSLRQARDQGDLDRNLEVGRQRLAVAEKEAARALVQLPLWIGPLETLETVRVPTVETIDCFEAKFTRVNTEQEQLRAERQSTVAEQAEADSALEHLRQIAGTMPTEDDLIQTRALRDQRWRLIRRAWETNGLPTPDYVGSLLDPRKRRSSHQGRWQMLLRGWRARPTRMPTGCAERQAASLNTPPRWLAYSRPGNDLSFWILRKKSCSSALRRLAASGPSPGRAWDLIPYRPKRCAAGSSCARIF